MEKDDVQRQRYCNCEAIDQFQINADDEMLLCTECFALEPFSKFAESYKDIKRTNVNRGNK